MKSASKHSFARVPSVQIPRTMISINNTRKTTLDSGYLVPVYLEEVLPGDTFKMSATFFCRAATPIVPIMDNIYFDTFWFFVPERILWENFTKMMGENENPDDPEQSTYSMPIVSPPAGGTYNHMSLEDYFGLPTDTGLSYVNGGSGVRASFHRAYNKIWNSWFRDQWLQDSVPENTGDGPDTATDYELLKRGKRHDYFTSCLPYPQSVATGVDMPLAGSAPVYGDGHAINTTNGSAYDATIRGMYNDTALTPSSVGVALSKANATIPETSSATGFDGANSAVGLIQKDQAEYRGYGSGLYADLSEGVAATVNQFRVAVQLQRFYERQARGGRRFVETIKTMFGVICPDFRAQRPEYLGGSSTLINVNVVPQTSATDETTPKGDLSGFISGSDRSGFNKSFTEWGVVICLVNVRADLTYQNGTHKKWCRQDYLDFYWPTFAYLGEQEVLRSELWTQGTLDDEEVFGYQERYAEYRYKPNEITGMFRSHFAQSLDIWHLAQNITSTPYLGSDFIEENPTGIKRMMAVQTLEEEEPAPEFYLDCLFENKAIRPMPMFGVPGLMDHF